MIRNYRISVDGQFYTGEKEAQLNTWRVDPWSNNSFQTKSQMRNILTFEPKENNNFKVITGVINLLGEIKKVIQFVEATKLLSGSMIQIEAEPYTIPLVFDLDYFLGVESELSKQKVINSEMKKQLDIATDLGQKRFEKIIQLELENKELAYDKMNLMQYASGVQSLRLVVIDLLLKNSVICDDCGGSGGVEVGENEINTCAKCDGSGLVLTNKHNKHDF